MSSYTVFIPRVFSNISQERISNVFHDLNIGSVEHVDLVPKTSANGKSYNMAFVHFAMIYNTSEATKFRQEVEDPEKKAILQYDGPWFWLVLPFEQKDQKMVETEQTTLLNSTANNFVPHITTPHPTPPTPPPLAQYHHLQSQQQAVYNPPPNEYLMANMIPVWILTPHGPVLQWGCPQQIPTYNNKPSNIQLVPPQVAYGRRNPGQRQHPRKKVNIHQVTRENMEDGEVDIDDN